MKASFFIRPLWPAPSCVQALTTVRQGGVSQPPYDHFNLSNYVGDRDYDVKKNRNYLRKYLDLYNEPIWLKQIHSTLAVSADPQHQGVQADASFTQKKNHICAVLTADCLPLLICNTRGTEVAAIHAGWRGLASGIIESTLRELKSPRGELLAWLGPAIGPRAFRVDQSVYTHFLSQDCKLESAFARIGEKNWCLNLYAAAKLRLNELGIYSVYGGQYCTYTQNNLFFSYRRSQKTGRMATLIWIK